MSDFEYFGTTVLADTPEFFATLEELRRPLCATGFDQMLFLHIEFHDFAPASLRKARQAWATFRTCVTAPIFAYGPDTPVWERFVRSFGFQELTTVPCADGRHRRLFINLVAPSDAIEQDDLSQHKH